MPRISAGVLRGFVFPGYMNFLKKRKGYIVTGFAEFQYLLFISGFLAEEIIGRKTEHP